MLEYRFKEIVMNYKQNNPAHIYSLLCLNQSGRDIEYHVGYITPISMWSMQIHGLLHQSHRAVLAVSPGHLG